MMPQDSKFELLNEQAESSRAVAWAKQLRWLPALKEPFNSEARTQPLKAHLEAVLEQLDSQRMPADFTEKERWLHENQALLHSVLAGFTQETKSLRLMPQVRTPAGVVVPRVLAIAEDLMEAEEYHFTDQNFSVYIEAFQSNTVLEQRELGALIPALNLVLLERIASDAQGEVIESSIRSLWQVKQAPWKDLLEPLVIFDRILRNDPAAAYSMMDFASRELYRGVVVELAQHSDCSEVEVAERAVRLAQDSQRHHERDPRSAWRKSHVGYYLVGDGADLLLQKINAQLPFANRLQRFLRRHPDEFYLYGIELLTLLIAVAIIFRFLAQISSFTEIIFAIVILALPCSQSAVEVMNYLTTALLRPRILPKLDFSDGVTDNCITMVAVPTLLLNEEQVKRLMGDLEVRYLGNASRNLHFALLTDLPDSLETPNEDSPLVDLCTSLIQDLNERYAGRRQGSFFLFHRHRVFNRREGVWMGFERKRGKLLDFNQLILGSYDSFPVKIGDLSVLPRVRYVLTLDSDTELPRGSAVRMIGALAHPLNQAIIDPEYNIVHEGYCILQPRVGISVQSASRSRLADIYSGQTGFDIYTHANSDVYQDLYGEAIFTGKGLYEVSTLHQVLNGRFPRNSLLSHDLIEGAYGRVGLISDVEVIDDYPSHYSAYNRRKHRWLRGDWQIAEWLLPRVPNERGRRVPNPISFISRWKILDNLRRSLVELSFFLLFLLGWTVLPGRPIYWTLVTLAILFVPPLVQFAFSLSRSLAAWRWLGIRDAWIALGEAFLGIFFNLTFLAHQALLSADAILRTLYRRIVSQERMLEWETAAEAELGTRKRTPVDILLNWTPLLSLAVAVLLFFVRRPAFYVALPLLVLWASSKLVSLWLNLPPPSERREISDDDRRLLRRTALYTWRYFAQFSTPEHNWLIPDNFQASPPLVAARLSPTNLGLLLNARQVACELGFITVPEFLDLTEHTLSTMSRLEHYRGHLFNWYDTRTLAALPPKFVSSVDNGNLLASLITLKQGCISRLDRPLVHRAVLDGYMDYLSALIELGALPRKAQLSVQQGSPWLPQLLRNAENLPANVTARNEKDQDTAEWLLQQARRLAQDTAKSPENDKLMERLRTIAATAERMIAAMDFTLLLDRRRKLLSIGYDVEAGRLHASCYDLLASESRTATFLAIAKGDAPQECWFHLSRAQTSYDGRPLLISWTGTMFEYLMPALWMRSYPNTLLHRTKEVAVTAQQAYAASLRVPWGISESSYAEIVDGGSYGYRAFGVPQLAVQPPESDRLVIAPYATLMALDVDPEGAVRNIKTMKKKGWFGDFGFVEAADFTALLHHKRFGGRRFELVPQWMAHHQGMSLLALANVLNDGVVQTWFHNDRRVQATEQLLHERPLGRDALSSRQRKPRAVKRSGKRPDTDRDKDKTKLALAG